MTSKFVRFILLLITSFSCNSPISKEADSVIEEPVFPYSQQTFNWSSIETTISQAEKKNMTDSVPWLSDMYAIHVVLPEIHPFDFNGDGLVDFVYNGPGPNDNTSAIIGINQGSTSSYFNLDGRVVDIKFSNNRVVYMFTVSLISTSPGIEAHRIVKVDYQDNLPTFTTIFESEKAEWTPLPDDKQSVTYEFKTIADTIIGRDSPIVLDTPYNYILEINGNQFGKIIHGTTGRVIGQKTDSLKNTWLCVLIHPENRIIDYPLYPNGKYDSTDLVSKIVWVRDTGIKRVD